MNNLSAGLVTLEKSKLNCAENMRDDILKEYVTKKKDYFIEKINKLNKNT